MSSTPDTVTETLLEETRKKRRRIAASLWPRARLIGEILYHQIDRDRLFTQAAALTYKTLFSLLPIFVLSLLIVSTLSDGKQSSLGNSLKQMIFDQLNFNNLNQTDANGKSISLAAFVDQAIANAQGTINGRATGLVAFGVLLYGAISLMIVIESTFNQMYGSVKPRSWPRRIMLYWCVLTLGPLGVAASLSLGRIAYSSASSHVDAVWVLSAANIFISFLVSWLLILLMYRLIPDTRVNWRPALIGSLFAALAWEIGKWAFGIYVQIGIRNNVYGSLALLPLFMFWLYITWCVALLGLKLSYVLQFWPLLKRRFFFTRGGRSTGMSDLRWILSLAVLLHHRFKAGKATHIDEAAELLMLPNDVTGELMISLEKSGLVHATSGGAYSLARPSEAITAYDLLIAARLMCQVPPDLANETSHVKTYPNSPALCELERLETDWAKRHTLVELAKGPC